MCVWIESLYCSLFLFFFFKQRTAYEMRISDWSSDVCSSDLLPGTRELASTVLDKQVRIGRPTQVTGLAEATEGPAYATCAGLLNYAVTAAVAVPSEAAPAEREMGGLGGRLRHWLRDTVCGGCEYRRVVLRGIEVSGRR